MKLGSREGFRFVAAEILITAVGILLALSANSAWQAHNDRQSELRSLQEIRGALQNDRADLTLDLFAYKRRESAAGLLLTRPAEVEGMDTVFGILFAIRQHLSNSAPFESLKASGIGVIRDDSLRLGLLAFYSVSNMFVADTNEFDNAMMRIEMAPYLHRELRVMATTSRFGINARPVDYSKVINDNYFRSLLQQVSVDARINEYSYEQAISSATTLLSLIDRRIRELE